MRLQEFVATYPISGDTFMHVRIRNHRPSPGLYPPRRAGNGSVRSNARPDVARRGARYVAYRRRRSETLVGDHCCRGGRLRSGRGCRFRLVGLDAGDEEEGEDKPAERQHKRALAREGSQQGIRPKKRFGKYLGQLVGNYLT